MSSYPHIEHKSEGGTWRLLVKWQAFLDLVDASVSFKKKKVEDSVVGEESILHAGFH